MADKDLSLKDYLADAAVFADIFNLAFEKRRFIVDPKKLRELDSVQVMAAPLKQPVSRAGGGTKTVAYRERVHDVLKMIVLEEDGKRKRRFCLASKVRANGRVSCRCGSGSTKTRPWSGP